MATLEVVGFGCRRCVGLLQNAEEAVRRAGRGDAVTKVADYDRILALNPWALPALAVNGNVVMAGRIASVEEIQKYLAAEAEAPPTALS